MEKSLIAHSKSSVLHDDPLLGKLKAVTSWFVDGSPEGYETLQEIYPDYLYDMTRREIAIELGGKEIAKILDAEDNQELERVRQATDDLYFGRHGVYAPVHDFWSFIEMVLHVKKKELPELITAQNVSWATEDVPLEQLQMTWMPFLEQREEVFGPKPWRIAELQRIFFEKPEILQEARDLQLETASYQQHKFEQSEEPITVVSRGGKLELVDGNGRLYRALLHRNATISCHIGKMQGKVPVNYWVGAGWLNQFCLEVRGFADMDLEGYATGLSYLRTKLRTNSIALINYELFLRKNFPEFEDSLTGVLTTQ